MGDFNLQENSEFSREKNFSASIKTRFGFAKFSRGKVSSLQNDVKKFLKISRWIILKISKILYRIEIF